MTKDRIKQTTFKVQRYDPEQSGDPYLQEFVVPVSQGMTVLDGLIYIKENLDSSLAFRTSCRMGICGSCAMLINNYPHLACHTQIEEFDSDTLTVKSLPNLPIIKDLVPELNPLFEKALLAKDEERNRELRNHRSPLLAAGHLSPGHRADERGRSHSHWGRTF